MHEVNHTHPGTRSLLSSVCFPPQISSQRLYLCLQKTDSTRRSFAQEPGFHPPFFVIATEHKAATFHPAAKISHRLARFEPEDPRDALKVPGNESKGPVHLLCQDQSAAAGATREPRALGQNGFQRSGRISTHNAIPRPIVNKDKFPVSCVHHTEQLVSDKTVLIRSAFFSVKDCLA